MKLYTQCRFRFCTFAWPVLTFAMFANPLAAQTDFSVEFEKFVLENGLEVIFHQDNSDPVTAVALTFHVGSSRELPGKTGFAHLFEHLLFLESENLGKGGLDRMSSRIGGSGANGSTSRDRTNYFQTVPNDALEKMLWAEADKLGYFINTVTEEVLSKEKQVVKNEKRQGIDNVPYGHVDYVIGNNLYPENHPYSWQVIGSLEDIQLASLNDVKEFYARWYVPNNATLVVAGDFDFEQARQWVHQYFDEIPAGEEITLLPVSPVTLRESISLVFEDNFAQLAELRMTWPGVEIYQEDSYALEILTQLLSEGKKAPLNQVIIDELEISDNVFMFSSSNELAGEISLAVRAYPGINLEDVKTAINESWQRFETNGFNEADLIRIKAGIETDFYNGLSSVLNKAFELAQYNIFAGDPGYISEDIQAYLAVTEEDVWRVYERYLHDRPFVATSFVPLGQGELALSDSQVAEVVEESIIQGLAEESFEQPTVVTDYVRTSSSFDRTVEPSYGETPVLDIPTIWQTELNNGLQLSGIENSELPLVNFSLEIRGGMLLDDPNKAGLANLVAELMNRGTLNRSPEQLEEALTELGAEINVSAGRESIRFDGVSLSKNFLQSFSLLEEMLLQPRWDEAEFELAKQQVISQLTQQNADPRSISTNQFNRLLYGENNILGNNLLGTLTSIESITLDDLKSYYQNYFSPSVASFYITGGISSVEVETAMVQMESQWQAKNVLMPELSFPSAESSSGLYFYDVPDASQSVLRIGYLAMPATDVNYYPATVMNYILGGGGFASRLTQQLREGKAYTYGIGSAFSGTVYPGPFTISSGVRSNVTLDATELIKEILEAYPSTFSVVDMDTTKNFLLRSNARRFETPSAKLNMLREMTTYSLPVNYVTQREEIVREIKIADISLLAQQYLNPNNMIFLIVGDARTQLESLTQLGLGEAVLLNEVE